MKPEEVEQMRQDLLDVGDGAAGSGAGATSSGGAPRHRRRSVGRPIARGIGEVFITVGILMLLMVAYQLWWTNVESAQAIAEERTQIVQSWAEPDPAPSVSPSTSPSAKPTASAKPSNGTGFALLYIPRLRDHVWALPIMQGIGKDILAKGAGHYRGTAMPGEVGNFAIAAHRSTHSEPFANFPDLRAGDKVYVQTKHIWYVYTLTHDDSNLAPTDTWVIGRVPGYPQSTPRKRLLTMTTCTPRYGSTGRWAWWGELTATQKVSDGPPDGITGTS